MSRLRVVIVGGGVAAIEALLGLRSVAGDRVEIELVSESDQLVDRPSSVAAPFSSVGSARLRRLDVAEIVAEHDALYRHDGLAAVDARRKEILTRGRLRIPYGVLVLAVGGRPFNALPRALVFAGPDSVAEFRELLLDLDAGRAKRVVFAVPGRVSWALPLYELALMTAARLRVLGVKDTQLTLTTPEETPLQLFGRAASNEIAGLLEEAGIDFTPSAYPASVHSGLLLLDRDRSLPADRVVTLPELLGPSITGLPHDRRGFLETDPSGRVLGVEDVYAAGDVTAFPIKQGGLAAQQADAVAESIAARAGASIDPLPFKPVLRGLLLAGQARRFLNTPITGGQGEASVSADHALWWPPTKVAAHHLGAYLSHASDEGTWDAPDDPSAIPVTVTPATPAT